MALKSEWRGWLECLRLLARLSQSFRWTQLEAKISLSFALRSGQMSAACSFKDSVDPDYL